MLKKIYRSFALDKEREDFEKIHETVEQGIVFKGTNFWILIFAIFIASVGLNVNSAAVIIGAMLVSPLMGPILGMGYSLATYDFLLLRRSVSNYIFAVTAGLLTSAVYFSISPLNAAHSELLARTSPTIYDVLIALFGGLAGIVGIISKYKGNVIPGVAIATALMPPLCTAGYGLATAKWDFLFGALYLFTINTVFIGAATLVTTRFLGVPILPQINEKYKKIANRWVSLIVIVTIIPSLYFGYLLVQKDHFIRNANAFVQNETFIDGDYLLRTDINESEKEIKLIYGGKTISVDEKKEMLKRIKNYDLGNVKLIVQQGFSVQDINPDQMTQQNLSQVKISRLQAELENEKKMRDSIARINYAGKQLLQEIQTLFPSAVYCSVSQPNFYNDSTLKTYYVVVLGMQKLPSGAERTKLTGWLKKRLQNDSLKLFVEKE